MSTLRVKYRQEWFGPIFFHLRHYIRVPTIRRVLVYGGKSATKTFSILQLLSIRCPIEKCNALAFRKEQSRIKDTLKPGFSKAISTTRMKGAWSEFDFKFRTTFSNELVLHGLDNKDKIKGIESFKYLLFDELDQFAEQEIMDAEASLRGMPEQKLFGTWNPIDETHWIKKMLDALEWDDLPNMIEDNEMSKLSDDSFVRLSKDGRTLLIKTNYHDNPWVTGAYYTNSTGVPEFYGYRDEALIDYYEGMKVKDEQWYNVNVRGDWGIRDKNKKFAYAFQESKHVKNFVPLLIAKHGVPYHPKHIIYLTFDFNVNPITCTAAQSYGGITFFFKCFQLTNSNTYALCDLIKAYFKPGMMFIVTGDASGKNRSTQAPDNLHNYLIIKNKFHLLSQQIKVPNANPRVEDNQVLVNSVLFNAEIWIQPGADYCAPLIYDLNYVEVNEKKEIKKDRSSSKKYADFLDNFRYLINLIYADFLKQPPAPPKK